MRDRATSPWAWTLGVSLLAAALVAGAGIALSRRVERVAEKPPGNNLDDAFRQTARRITALEGQWQVALEDGARRLLEKNARELDPPVTGAVQCSWMNPALSDPARAHRRADGREPVVIPVLEKFAKGERGEWVFPAGEVIHGSGWIEQPGRPLAWRQGNGKTGLLIVLDPAPAAEVVIHRMFSVENKDAPFLLEVVLRASIPWETPSPPGYEPGGFVFNGPGGRELFNLGVHAPGAKPDEVLRHVSRFGDWTLQRFYPVRQVVSWNVPLLAGSFALALVLLGGGVAIVSWQRKATLLAEQRVSFVNRVSHELRTPLTNLLLNTDLALDHLEGDAGKVRRRLGLIREETARLSRIVDNVQAFARIERGKSEVHAASCDVGKVLGGLRETFAPLFERKSITCEYDCEVPGDVVLDCDALSQILSNLLSNVEKYAGDSARARVAVSLEAGSLRVEVEDDGPGIRADARTRVFLPFERADSRVNEGASGTGLGLSISRDLARQMGGELDLLTNESGRGARFRLTIPGVERSMAS